MDAQILGPLWLSAQLALVTMILLIIIGAPIAWWLSQTASRWKPVAQAVVAMPIVLPPTVLGFYLLIDNILPFLFTATSGSGVAHGAHIGGFLGGLAIAWGLDQYYQQRRFWQRPVKPRPATARTSFREPSSS